MATQYSDILRFALPVQGELTGSWGDVVNNEITSLVEQAVAGLATIDTWTADSHTLTTTNGAADEARAAILKLTDTGTALTGAGELICPAKSKVYLVVNASGQVITVKTSAGTGVALPTGETGLLFCDGTNVENGLSYLPYDNTVSGLTADNVKDALDELAAAEGGTSAALTAHINDATDAHAASAVGYDNAASGLAATEVQSAVDEVEGRLDTAESNIATNASNIATNASDIAALDLTTVIAQTGGGALTAGRVNEFRDSNTYTLPAASSVSADKQIGLDLPERFKASTPVIERDGTDSITSSEGNDTSITYDGESFGRIWLTSNGVDTWSI